VVSLSQGIVKKSISGDQRFLVTENHWTNTGNTNARGVTHYFCVAELPDEPNIKEFAGPPKTSHYSTYIGSKGGLSALDEKPISFYAPAGQLYTTQQLDRKIFFWGWIVYRDTFVVLPSKTGHLI
jgi:hypothetical protein